MTAAVAVRVNGIEREVTTHPRAALLWALRDELGCASVKYGCGAEQCGACRVLIDGVPAASCAITVADADGRDGHDARGARRRRPGGARGRRRWSRSTPASAATASRASSPRSPPSASGRPRPTATTSCGPSTTTCAGAARTAASWPPPARRSGSTMSDRRPSGSLAGQRPSSTAGSRCATVGSSSGRARPSSARASAPRSSRWPPTSSASTRACIDVEGPATGVIAQRADHRRQRVDRAERHGGPAGVRPRPPGAARPGRRPPRASPPTSCRAATGVVPIARRPRRCRTGSSSARPASASPSTTSAPTLPASERRWTRRRASVASTCPPRSAASRSFVHDHRARRPAPRPCRATGLDRARARPSRPTPRRWPPRVDAELGRRRRRRRRRQLRRRGRRPGGRRRARRRGDRRAAAVARAGARRRARRPIPTTWSPPSSRRCSSSTAPRPTTSPARALARTGPPRSSRPATPSRSCCTARSGRRRAVARFDGGRLEIWTHSQGVELLRPAIAEALDLAVDSVTVAPRRRRRLLRPQRRRRRRLRRRAGRLPPSRPGGEGAVVAGRRAPPRAGVAGDGRGPVGRARRRRAGSCSWDHDVYSYAHIGRPFPIGPERSGSAGGVVAGRSLAAARRRGRPAGSTAAPTATPTRSTTSASGASPRHLVGGCPIRTSSTRGLGAFANVFAIESFMDELADAAGVAPDELPDRPPRPIRVPSR